MRVTLITSNVGSLFECDQKLHDAWIKTIMKKIHAAAADIVVINTQETGGKDFEHCAGQVEPLFKKLIDHLPEYEKQKVFVDLEWSQFDKFTALGQLILVKKMVTVEQYNFEDKTFYPVKDGLEIVAKALNNHPCVVNQKFPKSFRNGRWGRKGYLHTKWRINKKLFDFVNVHLFHDESNIAVVQDDPMIYSEDRKRALNYVIEELKRGENGIVPYVFIFGDFNFRLHLPSLLERITLKSVRHNFEDDINLPHHGSMSNGLEANSLHPDPIKRSMSAIEFRDPSRVHEVDNGCILRIEKKKFHYIDHPQLLTSWRDYRPDDQEVDSFKDALREFPVNFPPTYPWSEDPDTHECLMNTRAPAWCDRILMNQGAFQLASSQNPEYGCIGQSVCIGDHKVALVCFTKMDVSAGSFELLLLALISRQTKSLNRAFIKVPPPPPAT